MLRIKKENLHHINTDTDKKACNDLFGEYDFEKTLCTFYYRPKEMCVSIKKQENQWVLNGNQKNQSEYGCVYRPSFQAASTKEIFQSNKSLFNVCVWELFLNVDKTKLFSK